MNIGIMENWNNGTLEHWNIGILEYWNTCLPLAGWNMINE